MTTSIPRAVLPLRRDLHFKLSPERIANWHPQGPEVTLFFGAMSIFFPEGERMFIRAVRSVRDKIHDPELARQVTGFIAQEALHGREHQAYNDLMRDAGLPVAELEAAIQEAVEHIDTDYPPAVRLALTMALEHWTAILADFTLREPKMFAGADPAYAQLWRWHALEETEHKAVAFDVYREVVGTSLSAYWLRVSTLITVTLNFWYDVFRFHNELVQAQRKLAGETPRSLRKMAKFLKFAFISPGSLRRVAPAWAAYFKPGFHPWQHDNRRYLAELATLERELADELAKV